MTEAEIWKTVAHRIAEYFRPSPMPQYIINMIEKDVRAEVAEITKKLDEPQAFGTEGK